MPPVSVDRRHPDPADAMRRVTARPRDPAGRSLLESRPDPTRPHSRVTPHVTASKKGRRASGSGGRGCALACIDVSCVRAHVCMAYVFGPADASSGGAKPGPRELVVGKWGLLILRDICATQLKPHVMGLWDAGTTPAAARMGMAWANGAPPMGTRTARRAGTHGARQRPGEAPGAAASAAPRETRPASLEAPDCSTPSLSALNRIIFCISRFRCVVSRYICYIQTGYREIYWDPADAGAGDSGTGRRRAVIRSPSLESRPVPCGSRAELGDLRVSPTGRRTPVQPAGEPTCAGSRLDDLPWRAVHRTHRVVHIERQSSVPHDT